MYLHQYDYIFGIGTVFAMLDAYNNGASMSPVMQRRSSFLTISRRCRQLLGHQCLLEIRLVPLGHGPRHRLRIPGRRHRRFPHG